MSDQRRPSEAVIPAAGSGARFLPASKAVPAELGPDFRRWLEDLVAGRA